MLQPKTSVLDRITPDWGSGLGSKIEDVASVAITQIGDCQCDMRAGSCDANCCCDQECSEEELMTFSACKATGPELPSLEYCFADSSVAEVQFHSSAATLTDRFEIYWLH